jgi:hypothetical protein
MLKSLKVHLPILLLLQSVVFLAFGRVLSTPLWSPVDFDILHDAAILGRHPTVLFQHVGNLVAQPLLQAGFLAEYKLFGIDPRGYMAVNLVIHGLNAFIVYLLVNMLFGRSRLAITAALLFAFTVGSYGKILLSLSSLEPLLLASLYLLILYSLIRNDFRHDGRIRSPWFVCALILFFLAGLTQPATFSLLGCLLAYKFFFHQARGRRPVLSADLLILIATGLLFFAAQRLWGQHRHISFPTDVGAVRFSWISFKNIFRYLVLMLFPLQTSPLLRHAEWVFRILYDARTVIRVFLTIAIVSYSFFGIVFGSRAIRFFIAWTYITVLPFTGVDPQGRWLNLQYLYLVSLGFCVLLAASATSCSDLLTKHRWKRWLPYAVPLGFVISALTLTLLLNRQNRSASLSPQTRELHRQLEAVVGVPQRRP